jgi:hypothetical protein
MQKEKYLVVSSSGILLTGGIFSTDGGTTRMVLDVAEATAGADRTCLFS